MSSFRPLAVRLLSQTARNVAVKLCHGPLRARAACLPASSLPPARQLSDSRSRSVPRLFGRNLVAMRDACSCSMCIDPYSGQKTFQTTDIPMKIFVLSIEMIESGALIHWGNDVPGFSGHMSVIPYEYLHFISKSELPPEPWSSSLLESKMPTLRFHHDTYMSTPEVFKSAIDAIQAWGIIFITDVPESEGAVERIARKIGCLRNTLYGESWDVRADPQANNVANTNKPLGLHQDLLYMKDPPGIQLLHCIENTAEGGESLFADAFDIVAKLPEDNLCSLRQHHIYYHYKKNNHDYQYSHPLIESGPHKHPINSRPLPSAVNYSPPFQAPFPPSFLNQDFSVLLRSLKLFAEFAEKNETIFEYKLKKGECVIFNNRRILHGRKAFPSGSDQRLLRGCYLDTDVFMSCFRHLHPPDPALARKSVARKV